MAASNFSAGGFSYAQAAKGRSSAVTSQTSSSKVTSGAASPATGPQSEVTSSGSNWADDVESSVAEKISEPQKPAQDENGASQASESTTEPAKSEEKTVNGTSHALSSDFQTSSSITSKEEESSWAPNPSPSETTGWESKSQTSEPAWITERKERQSSSQSIEKTTKGEKKNGKEPATPTSSKPVTLQDAPPPVVNPWLKRADDAKAKVNAVPKPVPQTPTAETPSLKENERPRPDSRRKANSVASTQRESTTNGESDTKKNTSQNKRASDVRNDTLRSVSTPETNGTRSDNPLPSSTRVTPPSNSNSSSAPPPVRDDVSWPTPDTAIERDRKEAHDKESEEKRDEDATPTVKRKKQEWKVVPVTPNVIWETPSMNDPKSKSRAAGGERGGRGGNGTRGRGGFRGTPNGTNGGERSSPRTGSSPGTHDTESSAEVRGRTTATERESMPPPAKPVRASSASSYHERKPDSLLDGNRRGQSSANAAQSEKSAHTLSKESRPTKSPKKLEEAASENKDDEVLPKPIPRRNSVGTQTDEAKDSSDRPTFKTSSSDNRKENRSFEAFRESSWNGPNRGGKRGGRGRGGNGARELANGHPGNQSFAGYLPDFGSATAYNVPPSPSTYQGQRPNPQYTYPQAGRPSWNRGTPRSQSIPVDNYFGQRFQPYAPNQGQVPHNIQTYMNGMNGMYDMNGMPLSAVPYSNQMDPQYLLQMVTTQLEYYFSLENLLKDMFLRKHMDSQGFVYLDVVASFNRLKQLTQDKDMIKTACINSSIIEIRVGEDGKERIRAKDGWEQFLLPIDQREPTAQTDGPQHLERPERPQLSLGSIPSQYHGPASAGVPHMHQRYDRRSYDSAYPGMDGMQAQFAPYSRAPESYLGDPQNGEEMRGRATKSPIRESGVPPLDRSINASAEEHDAEPDSFPDAHLEELIVAVRVGQQQRPYHHLTSRTFSNGSIDSRSIMTEMEKPAENAQGKVNGENMSNGHDTLPVLSRVATPNKSRSSERGSNADEQRIFWIKDQDTPMNELPSDLTSEHYVALRSKALDQRNHAATGTCPYDLDVLYQFLCHFLIRNFNRKMYTEFKQLATDDAHTRHSFTGMHSLLKFYSQALSSHQPIRERVVKDYVELVRAESARPESTAFKQLRSAWRNGALNLKNRKKLADVMDTALKEQLDQA